MKKSSKSEKLILDGIIDAAHKLKILSRGLSIGEIILFGLGPMPLIPPSLRPKDPEKKLKKNRN